jgi:hypothetical protein
MVHMPPHYKKAVPVALSIEEPKSAVARFFTNGFIQGIAMLLMLAVALSGKVDDRGVAIAVAIMFAIGVIGICTHWPRVRVLIVAWIVVVAMLYGYLTNKPRTSLTSSPGAAPSAPPQLIKPPEATSPTPDGRPFKMKNVQISGFGTGAYIAPDGPDITLDHSSISGNGTGIESDNPKLKLGLRNHSTMRGNGTAIKDKSGQASQPPKPKPPS